MKVRHYLLDDLDVDVDATQHNKISAIPCAHECKIELIQLEGIKDISNIICDLINMITFESKRQQLTGNWSSLQEIEQPTVTRCTVCPKLTYDATPLNSLPWWGC
jgi:hypothetical protein